MCKLGIIKHFVFWTLTVSVVSLLVLFYYSVYFIKFRNKFVSKLDSSHSRELYEHQLSSNTMEPGGVRTAKNISLDAISHISLDVDKEVSDVKPEQSLSIAFPLDNRKNNTPVSQEESTPESKQHVDGRNDSRPTDADESQQEICPEVGPSLVGPLAVDQRVIKMEELEKDMSSEFGGWVDNGGSWRPTECKARVKMVLIIPYRNRFEHLTIFLHHIHPMLKRQNLDYRILVVEQAGDTPFNRAMLFNIGFKEALKFDQYQCFIFHDVDLIPEDDRNEYSCPKSPRHLSVAVDKFGYRLPYANIFGGAGSFSKEHFELINGFSNMFWGWGGEDDDLFNRINAKGLTLTRPSLQLGRYKMIKAYHSASPPDVERFRKLQDSHQRMSYDGLSSLKYVIRKVIHHLLYTIVTVDINPQMTYSR